MKLKKILIIFFSFICFALLGCAPQATQLPKPTNLKVVERFLTWDVVENADGYIVFADDQEYETAENSFDLSFLKAGKYVIEVMAVGDYETFTDSDRAKIPYVVETKEQEEQKEPEKQEEQNPIVPTESLRYTLLEDGTGYEVHQAGLRQEQKVVIPDMHNGLPVKKIGDKAFQFDDDPHPEFLPDPLRSGCNVYLKEVQLPKYLEEIGDNAFGYCVNLSIINIPEGVKKIGYQAFVYTYLKHIEIPKGVETIGGFAFMLNPLVSVTLPDSLKDIPNGLFYGCKNLETIRFPAKIESFGSSVVVNTKWYINFPNDYVIVDGFLLAYKGTAPMNAIPKTVTHIVDRAFSNEDEFLHTTVINFALEKVSLPASVVLGEKLFYNNEIIKEIVFENGTEIIPDYACDGCRNLEKVTIPDSVQRIGSGAFRSSGLSKIDLPSGLTSISPSTFAQAALTEITWPENLIEIGASAFTGCDFKQLNIPQSVTTIGDRAFVLPYLESLTLPLSVTHLGNEVFKNCRKLTSFHFSSLPNLGELTFYGCKSLTDVVLPEGMETLPFGTFYGCESLKSISLPSTLKEIGKSAFSNCVSLESVQLPSTLQTLGDNAFYRCKKLTALTLPDGVKTVGGRCFTSCDLLEEMDLSNVENIGSVMFSSCDSLKKVVLPKHMTSIPKSFFMGCASLTEIVLPKGIATISENAFSNCKALKTIYFEGTQAEFSAITVEKKNDAFLNATVCFYSKTEPKLNADGSSYDGNYWHYAPDNKTPVAWVKES